VVALGSLKMSVDPDDTQNLHQNVQPKTVGKGVEMLSADVQINDTAPAHFSVDSAGVNIVETEPEIPDNISAEAECADNRGGPSSHDDAQKYTSRDSMEEAVANRIREPKRNLIARACSWCCTSSAPTEVEKELQTLEQKIRQNGSDNAWVNTTNANVFFGVMILLNSFGIGIDIELAEQNGGKSPTFMIVLESIFLSLFWIEIFLRIKANGMRLFCGDRWGPFDTMTTFLGSMDAWVLVPLAGDSSPLGSLSVLRTLRLLRLMRLLRVFRTFKELLRLVKVLGASFQAMAWIAMLFLLVIYVSSVLIYVTLKKLDSSRYAGIEDITRSFAWTLFYHVTLLTCEGYMDIFVTPTKAVTGVFTVYWATCIVFLNFFMLNLMVGMIVQRTLQDDVEEEEHLHNFLTESEQFKETLRTLFRIQDINSDGVLEEAELNELLDNQSMAQILKVFNINPDLPRSFLMTVFGYDHKLQLTFDDFYNTCLRICGTGRDIRYFMLQFDVAMLKQEVFRHLRILRAQIHYLTGMVEERFVAHHERVRRLKPDVMPDHVEHADNQNVVKLVTKANEEMDKLEQQQDEMLAMLHDIRVSLFGKEAGNAGLAVRCHAGHVLAPMGTRLQPMMRAEYRHWACDAAKEPGGCKHVSKAATHNASVQRFHCSACYYDICEACYMARLRQKLGTSKIVAEVR